jgi:hypothetical protein
LPGGSRGLGDVYKRQMPEYIIANTIDLEQWPFY